MAQTLSNVVTEGTLYAISSRTVELRETGSSWGVLQTTARCCKKPEWRKWITGIIFERVEKEGEKFWWNVAIRNRSLGKKIESVK